MIKQSQNNSVVDFTDGSIATLQIHPKLRLKTESERLAVRILACDQGQYKLMSRHGRISGRFQGDELNEVDSNSVDILGGDIPMEPEYEAGKNKCNYSIITSCCKRKQSGQHHYCSKSWASDSRIRIRIRASNCQ